MAFVHFFLREEKNRRDILETLSCHYPETTTGRVLLPVGRLGSVWSQRSGKTPAALSRRCPRAVGEPLRERPAHRMLLGWEAGRGVPSQVSRQLCRLAGGPTGSCLYQQKFLAHPQGAFTCLPFFQLPECGLSKHSQVVARLVVRRLLKKDLSGTEGMSRLYL